MALRPRARSARCPLPARAQGRLQGRPPQRGPERTGAGKRRKAARVSATPGPPGSPPPNRPSPPRDPGPTHPGAARGRAAGGRPGSGPWRTAEPDRPQGLSPPRRGGRARARREAAARAWPCPPRLRGVGVGAGRPGRAGRPRRRTAGGPVRAGRTREARRPHGEQRARRGASSGSPGPSLGDAHWGFEGGPAPRPPQGLLPKCLPRRRVFKPGRVS